MDADVAQLVEHRLAMANVEGSSPFVRSTRVDDVSKDVKSYQWEALSNRLQRIESAILPDFLPIQIEEAVEHLLIGLFWLLFPILIYFQLRAIQIDVRKASTEISNTALKIEWHLSHIRAEGVPMAPNESPGA